MKALDLFKAVLINDGIDKQEPFARSHVLLAHCTVLLQASNLCQAAVVAWRSHMADAPLGQQYPRCQAERLLHQ